MIEYIKQLDIGWQILIWSCAGVLFALFAWGLTRLNKFFFMRIQNRRKGLKLTFLEHIISALIVIGCAILALSAISGVKSLWQTLLGGTAIISAVLAFAAQDVIKDILAGLMISTHKPFEIGDRILLEDGTAGTVENMTMRHVVLRGVDTVRYVIPNSKLDSMQLTNFSYEDQLSALPFRFSVGYDSDMALVKTVIARAVEESEYSRPGMRAGDGTPVYAPVYFIEFADSALIMSVTVYYEKTHQPAVIKNEINTRVREALIRNDIEIPYNYVNVVGIGTESDRR